MRYARALFEVTMMVIAAMLLMCTLIGAMVVFSILYAYIGG